MVYVLYFMGYGLGVIVEGLKFEVWCFFSTFIPRIRSPCRVSYRLLEDGTKVRLSVGKLASGAVIPRPELLKERKVTKEMKSEMLFPSLVFPSCHLLMATSIGVLGMSGMGA